MFRLADYEKEIRTSAQKHKIAVTDAADKFIYNLVVIRDHYTIFAPDIDFRRLGQQWNQLPSGTRIAQKEELLGALNHATRGL